MNARLLALYHRLPVPARSAAATLRGLYLKRWRHGADSERLVEAARERESWSEDRWRTWREERLAYVLHRAATTVPYYQRLWAERRRAGDRASWEVLAHWPVLEKDAVRANPRAFVADDCDVRRMFREDTSGTTGKPLTIWRSRETVLSLYAVARARTRRWYSVAEGATWARLGGQLVTPVRQRRPPFWVWNRAMRQLYMSTYHLAPDLLPYYLDALERHGVTYLAGYTSALVALARAVLRTGRRLPPMRAMFTNAEPVRDPDRAIMSTAFGGPVCETYGMAETVAAASECPAGGLHAWPEIGFVETADPDAGDDGDFICTGLLNANMPLIRYRAGDRGRLAAPGTRCRCGRALPLFGKVDGRTTDLVVTPDGREVFWLNPVFYGLPVRESQIVQESLGELRVLVAPEAGFGATEERLLRERLAERVGDMTVTVERVADVPRTSAGKLRAVVCRLSPEERSRAGREPRLTASVR